MPSFRIDDKPSPLLLAASSIPRLNGFSIGYVQALVHVAPRKKHAVAGELDGLLVISTQETC